MKISERKQRLRERGVVPISQESVPGQKTIISAGRTRTKTTRQNAAPARATQPRRQLSARYQLIFGSAYVVFAPILFIQNIIALRTPKAHHPGAFEIIMPVVFFVFGVVWVYLGLKARARERAAASATASDAPRLAKGSPR